MKSRKLFANALKVCPNSNSLTQLHSFIFKFGCLHDCFFVNKLISFYGNYYPLEAAQKLFDETPHRNLFIWNSILRCYCRKNRYKETLSLFSNMVLDENPDHVTIQIALKACAGLEALKFVKIIHGHVKKNHEIDSNMFVGSCLIDVYSKCGLVVDAVSVFEEYSQPDIVLWTTIITGCEQNGYPEKALSFFSRMVNMEHVSPDPVTLLSVVSACSRLLNLKAGSCVHGLVNKMGFEKSLSLDNALLNLYSKTGFLNAAARLFRTMKEKDVISWASMISCYAHNGAAKEALNLFYEMIQNSLIRPNDVTFLSALSACSHAGLAEEGIVLFDMMVNQYQLTPDSNHYGIMVDLLGRTGELAKAMDIIDHMPLQVGAHVWGAFLGACRIHQKTELGEIAVRNLLQMDSDHAGHYILLSNIYAADEKWDNVARIRTLINQKKMKKVFGESVLEVENEVHSFVAADRFHPKSEQIYTLLNKLELNMKEEGYVHNVRFFMND